MANTKAQGKKANSKPKAQTGTDLDRPGQTETDWDRLDWDRLGQTWTGWDRLGQIGTDLDRLRGNPKGPPKQHSGKGKWCWHAGKHMAA